MIAQVPAVVLSTVLGRGWLPEELPPTFTSAPFAAYQRANSEVINAAAAADSGWTPLLRHSLGRHAHYRRMLGIPHPRWFLPLATAVASGWSTLQPLFRSKISLTTPVFGQSDPKNRAISPKLRFPNFAAMRARAQSTRRYVVRTDIARYYGSIYTHSIPWAVHTKELAKRHMRSRDLIGNEIDRFVRSGQEGQTIGIPTGPDTLLVISELILCAIDRFMKKTLRRATAWRHMDDYQFFTDSFAHAEDILGTLQDALGAFELAINPLKTSTTDVPTSLDAPWLLELKRIGSGGGPRDVVAFADRALELWRKYPQHHVVGYAHGCIENTINSEAAWLQVQPVLFLLSSADAGSLRASIRAAAAAVQMGYRLDQRHLEVALNTLIARHAKSGHHNEVAWALWGCLSTNTRIHKPAAEALERMEDPVVALLALDAKSRGLVPRLQPSPTWLSCMTTDSLSQSEWLLGYEASLKGWLPSRSGIDHIAKDPFFAALRAAGVSFYDTGGANAVPLRQPVSLPVRSIC